MSILTPHGRWMVYCFFSVGVATQHFDQLEKTNAIRVGIEVRILLAYGFYGFYGSFYKEVSSRRDGGAQDPRAGWKEQGQPLSVFYFMFLVFCLGIIFQSGLESPTQFLLWAGEPKVYLMLFHLLWGGEPKVNLRLLLSNTLSWWEWYRGYL